MKRQLVALLLLSIGLPVSALAQLRVEWNAYLDLELTKAGELSHYYYNEIHRRYTGWAFDLGQVNLLSTVHLGSRWQIQTQLLAEREEGRKAGLFNNLEEYQLRLAQFSLSWRAADAPVSIRAGRFINPFGFFFEKQLYKDRTFINLPLAYSHYTNISRVFGFVEGLFEDERVSLNGAPDWGTSTIYRLGYKTGLQVIWGNAHRLQGALALVDGANTLRDGFTDPLQWGVIGHLKYRPTYFAKLGLSLSHGTFMEAKEANAAIDDLSGFRQTQIGLDYQLGFGYFQASGAFISSIYRAPSYLPERDRFLEREGQLSVNHFSSFSGYLDLKYEPALLPGSFAAYRIELLTFGNAPAGAAWDDRVVRHSLALGYKLFPFAELRMALGAQSVDKRDWNQRQRFLRLMLSVYY